MPTDPKTGRPIAGPADDATRKRMLAQRLAEREPVGLYESKRLGAPPPPQKMTLNPVTNLRERKAKLNKVIEESGG